MKVLKGSLKETRFDFPKEAGPTAIKETVFQENQVTYMSDDLGLHRISNPDPEHVAVSLHRKSVLIHLNQEELILSPVYTPPNAAREGCNIFNEKTGHKSHVTQSNFYSVFGRKVDT